ncbi:MAG: hypothetical protein KKD00_00580 [Gammaproteobacteria bacterium]|nr:hypothetical protein [Gammaproteobacteria bacterium]
MTVKISIIVARLMLVTSIGLAGLVFAQQQEITLEELRPENGNRQAALFYRASNNEPTTGIGFRVHFASSNVSVIELRSHLELSNVGIQILDDVDDLDNNISTDSYINAAWVDLNGEWPGTNMAPVKLYTFSFDAVSAEIFELFTISPASLPAGYEFVSRIAGNQKDVSQ